MAALAYSIDYFKSLTYSLAALTAFARVTQKCIATGC